MRTPEADREHSRLQKIILRPNAYESTRVPRFVMNVAFLTTAREGGELVHVQEVAERLATYHDCTIDIYHLHDTPVQSTADGLTNYRIADAFGSGGLAELAYNADVVRRIRSGDYDVVHAHSYTATFATQFLRLFGETPVVYTAHGAALDFSVRYAGPPYDYLYTALQRLLMKRFTYDRIATENHELKGVLETYHDTVEYIPNGVDVDVFPEPTGFDTKELLFVGRLRPKKNVDDAIAAMESIVSEHPSAHLHIVGNGPLEGALADQADSRGIADSITMHGYVARHSEELLDLYRRSSLFLLPSDWEGQPLVLLEAWASGIPIVGADAVGIREFVRKTGYGTVTPLNDPERLAATVVDLLDRPDQLRTWGEEARAHVARRYSWERIAARTYETYRKVEDDCTT